MHHEKNPCLVQNHASRILNLYITGRLYTSLKFRHREKSSYLAEIMHDEKNSCLVKICTSREDFIPRWKLCIARRFISRRNLRIARRYSWPARRRTWIKKEQCLSIGLDCILLFLIKNKHHGEHRRWQRKKHQYRISIYLSISTSSMECIEDDIAKHKA